ncbi:DUF72 domain-containing protein [Acidovorax sp. sic0104]|uniref:DUF72 domain-containing protein n=1 Tax=Acidovorax sp. sic0104 TaxID=2854784 RepID=UPI001C437C01|nr:DUF72 domain-containing protein [Acidovorax sp. sic0104]MBV7540607.1 DUF72 domain-containing protein [Acidovorax sp. sic0104]
MQDDLFGGPPAPPPSPSPTRTLKPEAAPAPRRTGVHPAPGHDALRALAAALPQRLRLGTSSWTYPGWKGLVWEGEHSESMLSKQGLAVYAQHPLLRTVSIDRSFYRPLTVSQYERYASQVPDDFRFVVKAPSLVTDALVRAEDGRGREPNPAFLNPELARSEFVEPALQGLAHKLGALVFQLSPLPLSQLDRMPQLLERLRAMLLAQPALAPLAPDGVIAVEVRDPEWLTPAFAAVLREAGATYCLGLHPKMPPLKDQLPVLRALWPGPLVCRWNLHPIHGPYGYEEAQKLYEPYDRLHHPDEETRNELAAVIAGMTGRGQNAFVSISNHAEGSAPHTVLWLARAVAAATGSASAGTGGAVAETPA